MTVEAVIFDWGGTLTPWRESDGLGWQRIAARLVAEELAESCGAAIIEAENAAWRRAREEHRSATLAELFAAGGIECDERACAAYKKEWEWASHLDPDVPDMLRALRSHGIRVGLLSNTVWPGWMHDEFLKRDGVHELFDGTVYTSEIPWTKPHPEAFRAAMQAVGAADPARCVYVGDRLFDDIHGGAQAGMKTVHIPHSIIPDYQRGHTEGRPDAVITRLAELPALVAAWKG